LELKVDDILKRRLADYAERRKIVFAEQLGLGLHGIVCIAEDNVNFGRFAVKIHRYAEAYRREKAAYLRLREVGLCAVRGFNVPQMLRCDDEFLAIEMSIVVRPFILDFAATWLDEPPDFPRDFWQDELEKREVFGDRWAEVQRVLAALETHGLHMFDVTPTNIAFRDEPT
jgi:hypothetical protein